MEFYWVTRRLSSLVEVERQASGLVSLTWFHSGLWPTAICHTRASLLLNENSHGEWQDLHSTWRKSGTVRRGSIYLGSFLSCYIPIPHLSPTPTRNALMFHSIVTCTLIECFERLFLIVEKRKEGSIYVPDTKLSSWVYMSTVLVHLFSHWHIILEYFKNISKKSHMCQHSLEVEKKKGDCAHILLLIWHLLNNNYKIKCSLTLCYWQLSFYFCCFLKSVSRKASGFM